MKKTIVKAILVATMLVSVALGSEGPINAAAATTPAPAAGKTTTPAPVMTDNLSKYGLKKDVELPVTVTAGGLSYTLHKVMIYDINSSTAISLQKQYKFVDYFGAIVDPQYLIWTKITITNKSNKTIEHSNKDMLFKWRLFFENGGEAVLVDALSEKVHLNSKQALYDFKLQPGESLITYQAMYYKGNFKYLGILLSFNGESVKKYIVNRPVVKQ
ncbi:hypothetical protein H1230_26100 [Paenibacillus sp. 19GGS1-52]|uniref:hypothetical protein n=1 Tax=Paenibacillus sp. 19GGS1-52 TaxID=2758563 RepID=UPI001EFAAD6D|nr:hypothetical protein [Paenibacillus sp. 19GGS1-52]ULO06452.1 hypothetical protein H1230_26100 [Paenibacillus sp. 19GGS1-52]